MAGSVKTGDHAKTVQGDWRVQTPCRLEVLGPSGSGKSTLILKMVEDDSIWDSPCRCVAYCAPTLSDREDYLEELRGATDRAGKELWCMTGLPDPQDLLAFSQNRPVLVFLDDLPMFEDLKGLDALVGMFARHMKLNLVMAVQNHFLKKKGVDFSFVSRNLTGMFILTNRADALLLNLLNTRLSGEEKLSEEVSRRRAPQARLRLHLRQPAPPRHAESRVHGGHPAVCRRASRFRLAPLLSAVGASRR